MKIFHLNYARAEPVWTLTRNITYKELQNINNYKCTHIDCDDCENEYYVSIIEHETMIYKVMR